MEIETRKLSVIAEDIKANWKNVYFGAVPYLKAMSVLTKVTDTYYEDSGASIIIYFLSNATYWRGKHARRIKEELKELLKQDV